MSTTSPAYLAARKHYDEGRLDDARQALQRALQRSPSDADLNMLMGAVLLESGQAESSLSFLERAAAQAPQSATARAILGEALMHSGKLDAAEKCFRRVIEMESSPYSSRINLASILIKKGAVAEAESLLRLAAADRPDRFEAVNNLALLLLDGGRADEAAAMIRERLAAKPGDPIVSRCLANILNYTNEQFPGECLEAHRRFGDSLIQAAAGARASLPAFANSRDPARRVRLAYMSPDFREHSVAYFIAPLLRHHDRERFEVFAYSNTGYPDRKTHELRGVVDHWRDIARTNDVAVARQARVDGIDILIDLAGLTNNHRLGVLALRSAPVQITYCGYPNTTGLSTVDYRIVDAITDPPGSEALTVERLLRIPGPGCFSCYQPPADAPAPVWDSSGPVAFGSFNVLSKVSPRVVEAWSTLMNAVPEARLILKARSLAEPAIRERYTQAFAAHGIGPERLELHGPVPSIADHLALYSKIAVALDPFPYGGTTTTCEAVWMGVPVVTLAGHTHAGRVGASIMTTLGEPSLIAKDTEQYQQIAATLARDTAKIAALRSTLRARVASSPLCDAVQFTGRFESALLETWRTWCGS